MSTLKKTLTKTWSVLSTSDCYIQKQNTDGNIYIAYDTVTPTGTAIKIEDNQVRSFAAPTTGSIYARADKETVISLTEL